MSAERGGPEAGGRSAGRTLIRAGGLSFRYPGVPAPLWEGLDFELREGDRLLLAGPSGSGKSTLLGIMSGLVPRLTSGRVGGTIERSFASYGLVMQNPYAQLVAPTVFEELAFCLENAALPVSEIRDRVEAMLDRVGIGDLKERSCATLSGGEAQKLSLACALIGDPEVLFLDEPTAYLDPWSAEDFFKFLESFAGGRTMVVVEHRVGEASALIDRVFLLDGQGGGGVRTDVAETVKRLVFAAPARSRAGASAVPDASAGADGEAKPKLEISGLSHRYRDRPVLDGLSLSPLPGHITVVMGPSGSGKSTLLKKIAGWLPPGDRSGGELSKRSLFFAGRDWLREKPKRRAADIVFIPQNPEHFFLTMSLRDELAYTGAPADTIRAAAGRFRLPADSIQHPASLSEGEKRRLTLACAFLDPRPLVLMDEPSYGLDLEAMTALIDGLFALRDQNRTVLIVTHSPELAQTVADELFVMRDGKLFALDPSGIASFRKSSHGVPV